MPQVPTSLIEVLYCKSSSLSASILFSRIIFCCVALSAIGGCLAVMDLAIAPFFESIAACRCLILCVYSDLIRRTAS